MVKVRCEIVKCLYNDYDRKPECGVCSHDEILIDKNGVCKSADVPIFVKEDNNGRTT